MKRLFDDFYTLTSTDGWDAVGILQGHVFRGVFRQRTDTHVSQEAVGDVVIDWRDLDNPVATLNYSEAVGGKHVEHWKRGPAKPPQGRRPGVGEYVYVEELPEVIVKVPAVYPPFARESGVEGTVMVQALVLEDGTVGDTNIVKSIPSLDAAAVACVLQWKFKPALTKGEPVAVWVAIPVKFTLH